MTFGTVDLKNFQTRTRSTSNSVDLYKSDAILKKRIDAFTQLERKSTLYKAASIALWLIPLLGWFFAVAASVKAENLDLQKTQLLEKAARDLQVDAMRDFRVFLNGKSFNDPKALLQALEQHQIPAAEQYAILQLCHQGLFASFLQATAMDLLDAANKHAPLAQEQGEKLRFSDAPTSPYHNLRDITPGGKRIYVHTDKGGTQISSVLQSGLSVMDNLEQGADSDRVVFEIHSDLLIDLSKKGEMLYTNRLGTFHPVDGPVPQF